MGLLLPLDWRAVVKGLVVVTAGAGAAMALEWALANDTTPAVAVNFHSVFSATLLLLSAVAMRLGLPHALVEWWRL